MRTEPVQNATIVKRTFEGKTDPSKNNNPVTSKYMASYKYAVICTQYGKERIDTFVSKKDASNWIEKNSVARDI